MMINEVENERLGKGTWERKKQHMFETTSNNEWRQLGNAKLINKYGSFLITSLLYVHGRHTSLFLDFITYLHLFLFIYHFQLYTLCIYL